MYVLALHYNINFYFKSTFMYSVPIVFKVWSWSLAAVASGTCKTHRFFRPHHRCTESDALRLRWVICILKVVLILLMYTQVWEPNWSPNLNAYWNCLEEFLKFLFKGLIPRGLDYTVLGGGQPEHWDVFRVPHMLIFCSNIWKALLSTTLLFLSLRVVRAKRISDTHIPVSSNEILLILTRAKPLWIGKKSTSLPKHDTGFGILSPFLFIPPLPSFRLHL